MKVATMTFRLHAPWVHNLKEKRMIVKSLVAKLQNKFHVSAAEVDEQDVHQIIYAQSKRQALQTLVFHIHCSYLLSQVYLRRH